MSFNEKTFGFNGNKPNAMIFSDDKIQGCILEKNINDDIFLIKADLNIKNSMNLISNSHINGMMLCYNIKGKSHHKSKISSFQKSTLPNYNYATIIKDEQSISSAQEGELKKIVLIIKKNFIEKVFNDSFIKEDILSSLQKNICHKLLFYKKTSAQINLLINEISSSPFEGNLNEIFIQSKVLELIYLETKNMIDNDTKNKAIKLDDYDIEAIKRAKEILIENLQETPSILELSKMVRINDFKLKSGFKKVFGTTPHNLVLGYKMDLAKKLLIESDMNVSEISKLVGYKHAANFTTAFMRKFHTKPIDLMKNRKYYY